MINQLLDQLSDKKEKLTSSVNKKEVIANYMNIKELDRETVDCLIDSIVVGKKNTETKEIPIEIVWNF